MTATWRSVLSLTVVSLACFCTAALSETFYVSPGGDDGASGTSPDRAWRTLARVCAADLSAGDAVLLQRGGRWREQLTVPASGSEQAPLAFGAYGEGPLPVIDGTDLVTGWTEEVTRPDVWAAAFPEEPWQVFLDGVPGRRRMESEKLEEEGDWRWDAGTLHLRQSADPSARPVEASRRDYCILLEGRTHVAIADLQLHGARRVNVQALEWCDGFRCERCVSTYAFLEGIRASSGSHRGFVRGVVRDCRVTHCGSVGILVNVRVKNWQIINNEVHHNGRVWVKGRARQRWSAGIKCWGGYRPGNVSGMRIEGNTVFANGYPGGNDGQGVGIWLDDVLPETGTTNVICRNRVYNNNSWGIYMEKASNTLVFSNIVFDNAKVRYTAGVGVKAWGGRESNNNRVFHNVVYGDHWWQMMCGCWVQNNKPAVKNNVFKNNVFFGTRHQEQIWLDAGGDNDGRYGSGNVYEFNCIGPEGTHFVRWGSEFCDTCREWASRYGKDTKTLEAPPGLVAPGEGNFRLRADSPCLSAGDGSVEVPGDFAGRPFDPEAPNLGAWAGPGEAGEDR